MSKCDFNKVAFQLNWNHTPVNLLHIFKTRFPQNNSRRQLLYVSNEQLFSNCFRFAQTKLILFIFFSKWVIKEKRKFSVSRALFSRNTLRGIKVQFSFLKYIISTGYTILIQLISAFLYDLHWTYGVSNSWEKPMVFGTKMVPDAKWLFRL